MTDGDTAHGVDDTIDVLHWTLEVATTYLAGVDERPVSTEVDADAMRTALGGRLPDGGEDPHRVVEELATAVDPGLVSIAGGRYFGFVTGGSVPAALGADVLTSVWDQNAFSHAASPAAAITEEVAIGWVKQITGLPVDASAALVTGCQMAHVTCLAAGRNEVLRRAGWDVAGRGLNQAPRVRVVTGVLRHVTVDRAVRLLGLGQESIVPIDVDGQGRMRPEALRQQLEEGAGPTIVISQAGEVNTGCFDPFGAVIDIARDHGAWVHVDGAFGIWAKASPDLAHLVNRVDEADSWAFDAHKWLNVPYDSGLAVIADAAAHRAAMAAEAAYIAGATEHRNPIDWTPEGSRRARGFSLYAALRSLGRQGVTEIVERCCAHARRFAAGIAELPDTQILNEVVLNQVLFRFGDDEATRRILGAVQRGGVAWMGGTVWDGRPAIRVSVSSWRTTDDDIDRTVAAFGEASVLSASLGIGIAGCRGQYVHVGWRWISHRWCLARVSHLLDAAAASEVHIELAISQLAASLRFRAAGGESSVGN